MKETAQQLVLKNPQLILFGVYFYLTPLEVSILAACSKYFNQLQKNSEFWLKQVKRDFNPDPKPWIVTESKSFFSEKVTRLETYKEIYQRIYRTHLTCIRYIRENKIENGQNVDPKSEKLINLFCSIILTNYILFSKSFGMLFNEAFFSELNSYPKSSFIYHAVTHDRLNFLRLLVDAKADVNYRLPKDIEFKEIFSAHTPLAVTATNDHVNCLKYLLEKKANVDVQDKWGITALYLAAQNAKVESVSLLLTAKARTDLYYIISEKVPLDVAQGEDCRNLILSKMIDRGERRLHSWPVRLFKQIKTNWNKDGDDQCNHKQPTVTAQPPG